MKCIILLLLIIAANTLAQTTSFVISPYNPQDITGYQGPFLWLNNQAPSIRYQQVYQNSDFQSVTSGPQQITEITFSTGAGALNVNVPNIQMDLSTTQKAPDGLSSIFSQNIGSDDTLVFSGPLHLFSTGNHQYEVLIPLQHPFTYDPTAGNLLLDVRNFQTIAPYFPAFVLTASGKLGDSSSLAIAFDVNSPTAQLGTGALLTEFTVTSVPEPSSFLLLLVGAIPFGLAWHRRNRKT